jgi:hypothetical protein
LPEIVDFGLDAHRKTHNANPVSVSGTVTFGSWFRGLDVRNAHIHLLPLMAVGSVAEYFFDGRLDDVAVLDSRHGLNLPVIIRSFT